MEALASTSKSLAQMNKTTDNKHRYDERFGPIAPHLTGAATSVVQKKRN
jgi:hypothetical protein